MLSTSTSWPAPWRASRWLLSKTMSAGPSRVLAARGISPGFVAENLQQIDAALHPHLTADEQAAVHTVLMAGCAICTLPPREGPDGAVPATVPDDLQVSQALFLQMILKGQRREALQIALEALHSGQSVLDVYTRIFQASLYRVGELWETNKITVAEEHMATAITQHVIAQLYAHLPPAPLSRGRIVLAGVQGEFHQVGATMVADVLEADGWDVRFLGSNMPHSGILAALASHEADILGISATMLFNVPQVRALIAEVHTRYGSQSPGIVVGGRAFHGFSPETAADLRANRVVTDLRGASQAMQQTLDETELP